VYTGTNNLDFRSLWINFESCLLIENEHVINSMNKVFENDLQNSTLVTQESLNEVKKLKFRISMWILNVYKPLL
jgi:cardiolipin synthase